MSPVYFPSLLVDLMSLALDHDDGVKQNVYNAALASARSTQGIKYPPIKLAEPSHSRYSLSMDIWSLGTLQVIDMRRRPPEYLNVATTMKTSTSMEHRAQHYGALLQILEICRRVHSKASLDVNDFDSLVYEPDAVSFGALRYVSPISRPLYELMRRLAVASGYALTEKSRDTRSMPTLFSTRRHQYSGVQVPKVDCGQGYYILYYSTSPKALNMLDTLIHGALTILQSRLASTVNSFKDYSTPRFNSVDATVCKAVMKAATFKIVKQDIAGGRETHLPGVGIALDTVKTALELRVLPRVQDLVIVMNFLFGICQFMKFSFLPLTVTADELGVPREFRSQHRSGGLGSMRLEFYCMTTSLGLMLLGIYLQLPSRWHGFGSY
ncbi:hypothetical protein EDD85DRAFT_955776 [Armillaria nabsnona]|nr:hypothetical protein EDD85DRAFT_955776 [Armillaria nabsnona]